MRNNVPRRTHLKPSTRIYSKRKIVLATTGFLTLAAIAVFVYIQFTGYEYAEGKNTEPTQVILTQPARELIKAIPENSFMHDHPVMLAYFNSFINPITIELRWSCAAENDNDYFIIERSRNNGIFSQIDIVKSTGSREKSSDYVYIDQKPGPGTMIYRLRQVSKDGSSSLVAIEKASRNNKNAEKPLYIAEIGPKNFDKFFNINYYSDREGGVSVELFDKNGNNVYKAYTECRKGFNTCRFIEGEMLKETEYTLRIANSAAAYVTKLKREYVNSTTTESTASL